MRCLAYTSRAAQEWPAPALRRLADEAADRNLALGLTGRLLFLDGRFIQVLEGTGQIPHDLYRRIQRDARHRDVVLLFDAQVAARSFASWGMDLLVEQDMNPGQATAVLAQVTQPPRQTESYWKAMLQSIRTVERPGVTGAAKATPQQTRAAGTVEQLLGAAKQVILRKGLGAASMQDVAAEANVSVQTAYRYFSSTEQMMSQLVRRWQMRHLAAFAARLAELTVASETALAHFVAKQVVSIYLRNELVPLKIRRAVLRDYHRIAYAELWELAGLMQAALARGGLSAGDAGQRGRVAMALAGIGAQAKMAALHEPGQLDTAWFRAAMARTLTEAMQA